MADNSLRISLWRWLPVVLIGLLLLLSLSLLHLVTQNPVHFGRYVDALLYLNGFILLLLSLAILVNLVRIIYQWHTRQAGSRFTLRLMSGFLVLTLLPVLVVSFFSMNFIGKNINRQFDERLEGALDDALELSETSLLIRSRGHLQQLSVLADELPGKNKLEMAALMDDWRAKTGAFEVVLLAEDLSYVTNSVDNVDGLLPLLTGNDLQGKLADRNAHYQIETAGDNTEYNTFSRVALRLTYGIENRPGILAALFQFSERERSLAHSVSEARDEYKETSFSRNVLKQAFRVALLVIIILTVLFSLWAAFLFSRRLTQPVRDLVEGTLAVASGDLQKKLPVSDRDDFSLLARSFNTMTKRLSHVQNEREQARRELQQEHDYLDVVLEHLSSGVMTLDEHMVIRRVNSSACRILAEPLQSYVGTDFTTLGGALPLLRGFVESLQPWLSKPDQNWQAEVELLADGQRKLLICRGAGLPHSMLEQEGYVLVFEDVTDVVQAEHDAAWGEVARRLAHEIKNPLTPIQLSAERLARKLSGVLDTESEAFLQRMTGTIVQQVANLKSMVNAFSDYAKAPALMLRAVDLNELVREVSELFQGNEFGVAIKLELTTIPAVLIDPNRFRQLLVNLIKNALEALGAEQDDACVRISTRFKEAATINGRLRRPEVVLTIRDNGPGVPEDLLPHLFEPYVTTKHKGTGLGLAIVKKIVEEHGGQLSARNDKVKGAIITIRLPVQDATNSADPQAKGD